MNWYLVTDSDIDLINGAMIKDASGTAVSMSPKKGWPDVKNYGNGAIYADGATFQNCFKAVEFIAYQPSDNSSVIKNCDFNQLKHGITSWNTRRIKITNNDFNQLNGNCIVTDGGSFDALYNDFDSKKENIMLSHSGGAERSKIAFNVFRGDGYGISSLGATIRPNLIYRNTFYNRVASIELDGSNHNEIFSNNIFSTANNGIVANNSGGMDNLIYENEFGYSYSALYISNVNKGLKFFKNCFDSRSRDVTLSQASLPFVLDDDAKYGSSAKAAANCFSHRGQGTYPLDVTGTIVGTTYYSEYSNGQEDCYDLGSSLLGLTYRPYNASSCARQSFRQPQERTPTTVNEEIEPKVDLHREEYRSKLSEWINDFTREDAGIAEYRTDETVNSSLKDSTYHQLIANSDFVEDRFVSAFAILKNQHKTAKAFEMLTPPFKVSDELSDFVNTQQYSNAWLENGQKLSQEKIIEIRRMAKKNNIYSGYAKALLYRLTGEVLHLTPVYKDDNSTHMSSNASIVSASATGSDALMKGQSSDEDEGHALHFSPNPASSEVVIVLPGKPKAGILKMYDVGGKLVHKIVNYNRRGSFTIDVQNFNTGLYNVTYLSTDEARSTLVKRLIIARK